MLATPLASVLLPILLFFLVAGGLLIFGRYYEKKTSARVKLLRANLRRIQSASRVLIQEAKSFSARDPEPYQSLAKQFYELLSAFKHRLSQQERSYVEINERLTRLKHQLIRKSLGAFTSWPPLNRELRVLSSELQQLNNSLGEVQAVLKIIHQLPWEISQQIRELGIKLSSVIEQFEDLNQRGLYGDTFEAALQLGQETQKAILNSPAEFLDGSEETVLQNASKETTIQVFDEIQTCTPRVNELLSKAEKWESQQSLAVSLLNAMNNIIQNLEEVLALSPPNLEVSTERDSWRKMKEVSQNLLATAARLEVESIPLVIQETDRLLAAAKDVSKEVSHAQREFSALTNLLTENVDETRVLENDISALENQHICPISWDNGKNSLNEFMREIGALGEVQTPRRPAQVTAHLATSSRIRSGLIELKRQLRQIEQERASLLAFLDDPVIKQIPELVQNGRSLIAETARYSQANWTEDENPLNLEKRIDHLNSEFNRLVQREQSISLTETDLTERLESCNRLLSQVKPISDQIKKIRQSWETLKSAEMQSIERIDTLIRSLTQLQMIVKSNPFLDGIASMDIDRLQKTSHGLKGRFSQPEQGRLETKIGEAANLLTSFDGRIVQWLDELNQELIHLHEDLDKTVRALDEIGSLDDPPINHARRLLNSQNVDKISLRDSRMPVNLDDLVLALRERSSVWQECLIAKKSLEKSPTAG